MADRLRVDLYCEDRAHELFARALLRRLATEAGLLGVDIQTRTGSGGKGVAVSDFTTFQRVARRGFSAIPDLLVVLVDSNCQGWRDVYRKLQGSIDQTVFPRSVVGCPDPHVERWCLADPPTFKTVVGARPQRDPGKCERGIYKQVLEQSLASGGQPILTGPMEYAPDLVRAMNLYRASKSRRSLGHFVENLRAALHSLATGDQK